MLLKEPQKKNINKALSAFRKLINLPVIRPEDREIKTEGHLTLGYIYYELEYYREAIAHLKRIDANHKDIAKALLVMSWAWIKLNDYQNAILTLNQLIKNYGDSALAEEAHFLLGECYLKLEFYDFAVQEYDYIINQFPAANNIAERVTMVESGIRKQEKTLEKLKVQLLVLESKLIDSIRLTGAGSIPKYIKDHYNELRREKDQLIENILTERHMFEQVAESIDRVRLDISRMESRRHWRAYAEYGKTRALFLKGMPN